jgi:Mg-chelatase subunit ChlD
MLAIPTMSVIEQGKMNSIIVDMGARSVRIAAVVNGAIVDGSFVHLGYGGDDVTDYQMKIMTERGYSFTTTSERDIVRYIKEKLSRSALDLNQVLADPASARTHYELPDGQVMTLDTERFRVNEVWFAPAVLGKPDLSVQSAIAVVLSRVPPELRLFLLNNMMMAGGPAMTQGLSERLALELKKILPASLLQGDSIRIQKIPASKYTSWVGASVLTSLRHFRANPAASGGISRADYDAYGPAECARYAMAFQFSQPPARSDDEEKIAEAAEVSSAASSTASIAKNDAPVDVKIAKKKKIVPQADVQTTVAPKGVSVILTDLPASASKTSEVSPSYSEAYHGKPKQPEGKTEGQTNIDDVVCTKTLAHCNQVLISPADLIQKPVRSVHTMDALPLQCEHCPGYFTSQNCFVIDAHNTTKWSCEFCGTMQSAASKRPDVPATLNTQELEYLPTAVSTAESKDAALSSVAAKKHLVVFVIDSSGSMQATTHVPLGVKLHVAFKDTKTFTHVSRLQFVQSAVRAKVLALARDDPNAIPLIVHFGSKVTVCCPDGTEQIIEGSVLHSSDALVAKGASIVERFTTACGGAGMRSGCRTLLRQLHGISPKGCTALGPALSCAVGMCGKYDSSSAQIVVCTDGEANTGVGTLNNKKDDSGFYASLAQVARDQGTSVSIMTIEGCEAGMEVLGTTADVTGGKVVVVDPNDLQKSFSSMASEIVTATDVNLTVVAGCGAKVAASLTSEGKASAPWKSFTTLNIGNATSGSSRSFSFALNQVQAATAKEEEEEKEKSKRAANDNDATDFDECPDAFLCPISLDMMTDPVIMSDGYSYEKALAVDWLSRKVMSPMTGKPLINTALIPNVALRHSIEDFLARKAKQTLAIAPEETEKEKDAEEVAVEEPAAAVSHIPVQVQLTFTDPAGITHVRLFTLQRKVSNSRKTVEASCNATVVAMETLHKAAALSQKGMYQEARIELISTQRLLQRSMTIPSQATYMTFVCLAEKLDQFMREAALQKDILQNTKAADQKDDEASMGMYNLKSLSRSEFEEQLATLVGC